MSLITATTELEAVNSMLATIGEAPVNSLDGAMTADVSLAYSLLQEINREVQTLGWSFNTDKDFPLMRDSEGFITIPLNAARVEISRSRYTDIEPVVRGTRLYDRKNHTYVFDDNLEAEKVVVFLAFTELPEAARRYILVRASRIFQDRMVGSDAIHVYTERDELNARRVLYADGAETDDLNFLSSPGTRDLLRRW